MQAKPGPRYPVSFASVHPFVAALLSACILNCAGCAASPLPLPEIKIIDENLGAIRSASSIEVYFAWGFYGGLEPKDSAVADRLRKLKSEVCQMFADALRPTLANGNYYLCWSYDQDCTESRSSPIWSACSMTRRPSPAQQPDVRLHVSATVRFVKNSTVLEERAIRFLPAKEYDVPQVKGGLWTAAQKPSTTLKVSARTWKVLNLKRSGPLFHPEAEVDVAQLETAMRAWAKARAVEVASELAAALRTQPTHE